MNLRNRSGEGEGGSRSSRSDKRRGSYAEPEGKSLRSILKRERGQRKGDCLNCHEEKKKRKKNQRARSLKGGKKGPSMLELSRIWGTREEKKGPPAASLPGEGRERGKNGVNKRGRRNPKRVPASGEILGYRKEGQGFQSEQRGKSYSKGKRERSDSRGEGEHRPGGKKMRDRVSLAERGGDKGVFHFMSCSKNIWRESGLRNLGGR